MNIIPIDQMKERGLYLCVGRNYDIAVWNGKQFVGPRYKFGWMIGVEQHTDADKYFGTVAPYVHVGQAPDDLDLADGFSVKGCDIEARFPGITAKWERKPVHGVTYYLMNQKLLDYLLEMKKNNKTNMEELHNELRRESTAQFSKGVSGDQV